MNAIVHEANEKARWLAAKIDSLTGELDRVKGERDAAMHLVKKLQHASDNDAVIVAKTQAERDAARELLGTVADIQRKLTSILDRYALPPMAPVTMHEKMPTAAQVFGRGHTTTTTLPPDVLKAID